MRKGDKWQKPLHATDDHLYLMVQCMEAWFLADREAMRRFFDQGFQESALPAPTAPIESVGKEDLYARLKKATRDTKTKGAYGKGAHSFRLLATLDPKLISASCPGAMRFFVGIKKVFG